MLVFRFFSHVWWVVGHTLFEMLHPRRLQTLATLALLVNTSACRQVQELPGPEGASAPDFAALVDGAPSLGDPCEGATVHTLVFEERGAVGAVLVTAVHTGSLTISTSGPGPLDTVLWLVGPIGESGVPGASVVMADDGPEGAYAELAGVGVPEPADYLIAVTTAGGVGLGTVTLTVLPGECAPAAAPEGCGTAVGDLSVGERFVLSCLECICTGPETLSCASLCDDGDPCTVDSCIDNAACVHERDPMCAGGCREPGGGFLVPPGEVFTPDGCNYCFCDGSAFIECEQVGCPATCGPGGCEDGDPCTFDLCDGDQCHHLPLEDGTFCGECGVCIEGACLPPVESGPCSSDGDCDDGNPCTVDTCVCTEGVCDGPCGCRHVHTGEEGCP